MSGTFVRGLAATVTAAGLTFGPLLADAAWSRPSVQPLDLDTGTVQGRVRDQIGIPIPGARVTVDGITSVTGADGSYSLVGVTAGSPILVTQVVCRAQVSTPTIVTGGEVTTQNITVGGFTNCQVDLPSWEDTPTVLALTGDDEVEAVAIPFPYYYLGAATPSSVANISTNGYVTFAGAPNSLPVNSAVPTSGGPDDAVFAFWDDLVADSSTTISTGVSGTAPNRRFAIEWNDIHVQGDPARRLSFQVVLHEDRSQRVRIQYQGIDAGTVEDGRSATVGLENEPLASQVSFNTGLIYDGLSVRPK